MNVRAPTLDGLWSSFQNVTMKQCPECGAQYEESVSFCSQDGRVLLTKADASARLCPNCANSIAEDAVTCPYCKADVSTGASPQWATRDEPAEPAGESKKARVSRLGVIPIIVLVLGIGMFAAGAFLAAGRTERTESQLLLEEKFKQLRVQDERIRLLQAELEQARKDFSESSGQVAELRNKFEESQRDLATSQTRIGLLNREIERLRASPPQVAARPAPPPVEPKPASVQPSTATVEPKGTPQSSPVVSRRPAEPGSYETLRATPVHAGPSESSPVLSEIGRGTRVAVVGSDGDWLEVRSRHGNPPGFIRRDDAMYLGAAN